MFAMNSVYTGPLRYTKKLEKEMKIFHSHLPERGSRKRRSGCFAPHGEQRGGGGAVKLRPGHKKKTASEKVGEWHRNWAKYFVCFDSNEKRSLGRAGRSRSSPALAFTPGLATRAEKRVAGGRGGTVQEIKQGLGVGSKVVSPSLRPMLAAAAADDDVVVAAAVASVVVAAASATTLVIPPDSFYPLPRAFSFLPSRSIFLIYLYIFLSLVGAATAQRPRCHAVTGACTGRWGRWWGVGVGGGVWKCSTGSSTVQRSSKKLPLDQGATIR